MKFYGLVTLGLLALTALEVSAHKFTFRNSLDVPVTVGIRKGIGENHDYKVAPAKGEITFDYSGPFNWGLAMDTNTVKLTKQGGTEVDLPAVFILSQKAYDTVMADVRRGGKANQEFSTRENKTGVFRDQVFDIVADINGTPRAIMVY